MNRPYQMEIHLEETSVEYIHENDPLSFPPVFLVNKQHIQNNARRLFDQYTDVFVP